MSVMARYQDPCREATMGAAIVILIPDNNIYSRCDTNRSTESGHGLIHHHVLCLRNKPYNSHQEVRLPFFSTKIRLEAATSRLEDLAVANTENFKEAHAAHRSSTTPSLSKDTSPSFNTGMFTPEQARSSGIEESTAPEDKSPVILDYERLIADLVVPWVVKSEKIEQVVGQQVSCIVYQY